MLKEHESCLDQLIIESKMIRANRRLVMSDSQLHVIFLVISLGFVAFDESLSFW